MSGSGELVLRWMIRRDMPEVLGIELASCEFPWDQDDFLTCLRQRSCIGMVAERRGRIEAFMVYELLKDSLRLLNFGVSPLHRRTGVATAMVDKLKSKLHQLRRRAVELEIRERNLSAQFFFREMGFVATEVLHGFYSDTDEDAYRMVFRAEWSESRGCCLAGGEEE